MKNPIRSAGSRAAGWAAMGVALAAAAAVPSMTRAACVGDCSGDGTVTVNELIQMVNIALGNAPVAACSAGDANGDGAITVNEIVAGVNSALNGCPVMTAICGDGVTSGTEECDPGSICIGGTNAGTVCAQESDCQGEGVCDTFGVKGPPGTVPRKVCSADAECGGAKCIHCKPFGGNGCSANCTMETAQVSHLVPGEVVNNAIQAGTSGVTVYSDIVTLPLTLAGTSTSLRGKPDANGVVHIAQKPGGTTLERIALQTFLCACVRGAVYKTCGGTQLEADGVTPSINCSVPLCSLTSTIQCAADNDCPQGETCVLDPCVGKKPCTAVAGPGNSLEGAVGCTSLPSVNYTATQDHAGGVAGPAIVTPGDGGLAGSQMAVTAASLGALAGPCTGTLPAYGPDHEFCTDDDPLSARGVPSIQTLVTGTATASLTNANGLDGNDIGPYSSTGNAVTCAQVDAGNLSGGALASAFTALNQQTINDIVATSVFISQ